MYNTLKHTHTHNIHMPPATYCINKYTGNGFVLLYVGGFKGFIKQTCSQSGHRSSNLELHTAEGVGSLRANQRGSLLGLAGLADLTDMFLGETGFSGARTNS